MILFHWLRDSRRAETRKIAFPPEWEVYVRANVPHYSILNEAERAELHAMIQVILDEKEWEGCGGLELTDEIRVTIAADACLLQLGVPHDYYRNVESILVYPSTVMIPEHKPGVFERVENPMDGNSPILGQAFAHGPVILVWDAVLHGARHPEQGHNVVFHEFAHKIDMLDGAADGTPPFAESEQLAKFGLPSAAVSFSDCVPLLTKGIKLFSIHTAQRAKPSSLPWQLKSFSTAPLYCWSIPRIFTMFSANTIVRIRQSA